MVGKRGQIKLSFGMIFSVIMIVIFLVFSFYGIRTFLGIQESATVGTFLNDFQSDVDELWKSTEGSKEVRYYLPNKVSHICIVDFETDAKGARQSIYGELRFVDFGEENLAFYPLGSTNFDSERIENIDLIEITQTENPFCIENKNGVIEMILSKDFGEPLVKIDRQNG